MSSTTQALLFALLGALLGAGVVLAWRISESQTRPDVTPAATLPPGIAAVLSVLRSSALVVDSSAGRANTASSFRGVFTCGIVDRLS